ncbi:copper chaperone PCu(A)C [Vibrio gallicus]|uniref:copper chaperone PCu(A)C n=1 Tax=Vibrio gallicus TaxID=190897 RepID=UPI0021C444A0|nr:copper chaperone PCu(A)C [Vibrio gallicus]
MKTRFITLLLCLLSPLAWSSSVVEVSHAWAKETPPTATTSAIFLTLSNPTKTDRNLISASTEAAGITELHTHLKENGIMKMRQVKSIAIPAGKSTQLKPHGLHVMLFDLKQPLTEGMIIPLSLTLDSGRVINLSVPVKKMVMHK